MTPSSPVPLSGRKCVHYVDSDRVPGRFGGVLPAGRGGPLERPVGELVDPPPRVLLEPVITAALGAAVAQAGSAARLVRGVVLEVALPGWPAACPCPSVTVTHQVVFGLRAAAAVRSRASHGSTGPMPGISPGRS